ncbi:unnamed protein product [Darwinula stevensoni]|uniref:Uncharacterized protein n=1 Tax=Darwinula stevensoni TaxID=69355 RepID=A0A7R9FRI4_9CRUS|nr:unnamed protein product [Darwinula stevensoni]CAG0901458.1 unnamed protein product [Darwinula stevensoni]
MYDVTSPTNFLTSLYRMKALWRMVVLGLFVLAVTAEEEKVEVVKGVEESPAALKPTLEDAVKELVDRVPRQSHGRLRSQSSRDDFRRSRSRDDSDEGHWRDRSERRESRNRGSRDSRESRESREDRFRSSDFRSRSRSRSRDIDDSSLRSSTRSSEEEPVPRIQVPLPKATDKQQDRSKESESSEPDGFFQQADSSFSKESESDENEKEKNIFNMKLYNNFGVGKKLDLLGMSVETGLHHRQKDKFHISRNRTPIEQFIKRLIGRAGNILGTLGNIGRMVFGFLPGVDEDNSSSSERRKRSVDDAAETDESEEKDLQCLYKGICTFMASSDEDLKILGGPLYPFIKKLIRASRLSSDLEKPKVLGLKAKNLKICDSTFVGCPTTQSHLRNSIAHVVVNEIENIIFPGISLREIDEK